MSKILVIYDIDRVEQVYVPEPANPISLSGWDWLVLAEAQSLSLDVEDPEFKEHLNGIKSMGWDVIAVIGGDPYFYA